MLNDPKAIAHVLGGQTTTYHLEESLREFLRMVTGKCTKTTTVLKLIMYFFRERNCIRRWLIISLL